MIFCKRKTEEKGEESWFLYVLECRDGTFYTGITKDIEERVRKHNSGAGARYTRGRRPVRVIHRERCRSRSEALKREKALKRLSRAEKEEYLEYTGR